MCVCEREREREYDCDEWGGAESRGSRARPVELMMMSDTCTTHRSRVPRRSSGRIKGGVTTVQDERGPGLDFNLCFVCGSRPWGAAALLLCLFMLLKLFKCSPVPASFFPFYELCYIGAETRVEGGTCCQKKPSLLRGSRCWGGRAARRSGETASGCPRRWCWNDRRSGGTEGSLPCSGVKEGWLPSERERRSRRRSPGGRSLLPSAMLWEEQGTGTRCRLPSNWRSHRRPPGGGASSRPPKDVQYHRMAPRVRASQLVEVRAAVCPGTGTRKIFFSSLPSLPSVSPHPSVSFSLASSVLTPKYATAAVIGSPPPPRVGGGGE